MISCPECDMVMEHMEDRGNKNWNESRFRCPRCRVIGIVERHYEYPDDVVYSDERKREA